MQTILRSFGFVIVASLLWTSPMTSAATQRAKIKNRAIHLKNYYLGTASWYGKLRENRKMANGKPFDSRKLTAASWYFPLGTQVRVANLLNSQSVFVVITDRGPNVRLHRIIDLSEAAAEQLDYVGVGLASVFVYPFLSFETTSAHSGIQLSEPHSVVTPATYAAEAISTIE